MALNEDAFRAKLQQLNASQESIEVLAAHCIFYKNK